MRILLLASIVILPFIIYSGTHAITGEPLSAVVLGLTLFVTVVSWFSGRSVAPREFHRQ